MKDKFRSTCPISSALDVIGDKWTLIIIRDLLFGEKETFKDLVNSEEKIATNILSSRLKLLEEFKIVTKEKLPHNKKTNIYRLTNKGINLAPLIIEMVLWGDEHIKEFNPTMITYNAEGIKKNKEALIHEIQENYKKKTSSSQD